jgi:hypothetical protein
MVLAARFPFRWVAVASAFGNLGIHLALSPDHLEEMPYVGVLFVVGSALLGLAVVGLSTDRDRLRTLAWLLGSVVCAVMFVSFLFSRTTGLPLGFHEEWAGTYEDYLGIAALVLELVFLGCAQASLTTSQPRPARGRSLRLPLHDRTAPLE